MTPLIFQCLRQPANTLLMLVHSVLTSVAISVKPIVIHHIAEQATNPLATPASAILEGQGAAPLHVPLYYCINDLLEALF